MATTPDVIFAQKATAIVKAAGLDPKAIDLETFRKWAAIIFTRAYAAIYKEQLISALNEFSSREEQVLNSQLVIDGLTTKTRNPALATISGIDIYQGNHRAIGILVGILFAEGQRLWLEKVKHFQKQSSSSHSPKIFGHEEKSATQNADRSSPADGNHETQEEIMTKLKGLYQSNQNVSPRELEKLLNRIEFLENRLRRNTKVMSQETNRSRSRSNRKSRSPTRPKTLSSSPHMTQEEGLFDEDDGDDDISVSESVRGDYERRIKSHLEDLGKQKKPRPSSAPTVRRVKQVSNRLYRPPLKTSIENHQTPNLTIPKSKVSSETVDLHEQYTYDLRTGRKIPLSVAQLQAEERKRQQMAMGNIGSLTKVEDELMGSAENANKKSNGDQSPSTHKAEYPGKRTEKSVEEWLEKMRKHLPNAKSEACRPIKEMYFEVYQTLDNLDLVISIEHCHNCEHHNVSLRHDPNEYIRYAEDMLRLLGQVIFQSGICIRLGVMRLAANITPKCKLTDSDSRIGAFEIQAACKTSQGDTVVEVIHSKLQSRRWPSKSVIEKRMMAFLSKTKAPSICRSNDLDDNDHTTETDGTQSYPSGRCSWEDTVLSRSTWCYEVGNPKQSSGNVQWIFDARTLINQPKFSPGATIWVENIVFANSCVEKYALLGTVKRYVDGSRENKKGNRLLVGLKYCNLRDEIEVNENDCSSFKSYGPNGSNNHSPLSGMEKDPKLPLDLEGLLLLGKSENCISWRTMENEDYLNKATDEIFLCRNSYFRQVRSLSWNVILRLRAKGINSLQHPVQQKLIDPYNNYSEFFLDYLYKNFATSDGLLNVSRLMGMLPKSSIESMVVVKNGVDHVPGKPVGENIKTIVSSSSNQKDHSIIPKSLACADPGSELGKDKAITPSISRPTIAKPNLTRPSMLIKRPSLEDIDKLFPQLYSAISYDNLDDKSQILNAFKSSLSEISIRSDDNIQYIPVDKFILRLHDFGLESIADNGVYLKNFTTFFSSDGKSTAMKLEEFIGWLDKNSRLLSKNNTPRVAQASHITLLSSPFTPEEPIPILSQTARTGHDSKEIADIHANFDTPSSTANDIPLLQPQPPQTVPTLPLSPRPLTSPRPSINDGHSTSTGINSNAIVHQKAYQNKDLVISSVILEGSVLIHSHYDSVYVTMELENRTLDATVCLARERGSKRRSFNVNWGEVGISSSAFADKCAVVSILVADTDLLATNPTLPHTSNTVKGNSPNSVSIPLCNFFDSSFEIKSSISLPTFGSEASSNDGCVTVTIHGHAHEAKEARKTRIMSMKPVELLSLRFDPLPVDDDDDASNGGSDDDFVAPALRKDQNSGKKGNDNDINENLFPKPSMHNLLATNF